MDSPLTFADAKRGDSWGTKYLRILHLHLPTLANRLTTAVLGQFSIQLTEQITTTVFFIKQRTDWRFSQAGIYFEAGHFEPHFN